MRDENLEFAVDQFLDDTLDPETRPALAARLEVDPRARSLADEHRKLTALLRSPSTPSIQWDRLAESISSAIDVETESRVERVSRILRLRHPAWMAAAAALLLALGLTVRFLPMSGTRHRAPATASSSLAIVIDSPQESSSTGPAVDEVSIGPGGSSSLSPYADEIDTRPARVAISAAAAPAAERPAAFPF